MNEDTFDQEIKWKLRRLDNTYPPDFPSQASIWDSIGYRKRLQRRRAFRISLGIAASLLLLTLVTPRLWQQENGSHPTYNTVASTQEAQALEYVNSLCRANAVSCSTPAFKELKKELLESSSALIEIEEKIALFGDDDQLQRAKIRIENHQARIIRAMIQTI